jgi:hypothetical protein
MLLCRCFECVSYSHSIHIRVNESNWPMCHCIHNPQWTKFECVLNVLIIAVHSISEWMKVIDQCVMVSAIHSGHNLKVFRVCQLLPFTPYQSEWNWPMCHGICSPQWTQLEGVSSVSIITVHSTSEWMELINVSWYLQSTVDTIWRCFERDDYSHSLHIRVNGTNQPMCHGIYNLQWTKYEGISSWSIISIHSVSEWMELTDQIVTIPATHSGQNMKVFRVGRLFPFIPYQSEWN